MVRSSCGYNNGGGGFAWGVLSAFSQEVREAKKEARGAKPWGDYRMDLIETGGGIVNWCA